MSQRILRFRQRMQELGEGEEEEGVELACLYRQQRN